MSPRPRTPSARFVSDRKPSDRRYSRPNVVTAAASSESRSQRTVLASRLADLSERGGCRGPPIRPCYTPPSQEYLEKPDHRSIVIAFFSTNVAIASWVLLVVVDSMVWRLWRKRN